METRRRKEEIIRCRWQLFLFHLMKNSKLCGFCLFSVFIFFFSSVILEFSNIKLFHQFFFFLFSALSNRPNPPPHRKTSLPKHSDVKKQFFEMCHTTLSDDVKVALRLPSFDSYDYEDYEILHLMEMMFVELNFIEKFHITQARLQEWLYEVYKHYNDVPFHNFRHCFCVSQMVS